MSNMKFAVLNKIFQTVTLEEGPFIPRVGDTYGNTNVMPAPKASEVIVYPRKSALSDYNIPLDCVAIVVIE